MHELETAFCRAWPTEQWRDSYVVLAVSGGADSVAMLRAALATKNGCGGVGDLFVAHLNHGLRGEESAADAAWLKSLCERLELPIEVGTADVGGIAQREGDGLEAAARSARYDFLSQSAEARGARFVAVAHTADDQIETVLHRILRGTGIDGLRGIPPVRSLSPSVTLVRPLLAVRRRVVLEYLAAIGQDYREDASNADVRWTRNRLRQELLPAIRSYFSGDVDAALLRLAAQAAESHELIRAIAAPLAKQCLTRESTRSAFAGQRGEFRVRIACRAISDQPPLIIREICKLAWQESAWPQQAMGYDEWQQLASLVVASAASRNLPGNVRAWREGDDLLLERFGLP